MLYIFNKLLLTILCFLTISVLSDVICNHEDDCRHDNYECDGKGCKIECSGEDSCERSVFTCSTSCSVECTGEDSCENSDFYFEGGDVTVDCNAADPCGDANFFAYNGTNVDFTCNGIGACEDAIIHMYEESTFSITCDGIFACDYIVCFCDDPNSCEITGDLTCDQTVAINNNDATGRRKIKKNGFNGKKTKTRDSSNVSARLMMKGAFGNGSNKKAKKSGNKFMKNKKVATNDVANLFKDMKV